MQTAQILVLASSSASRQEQLSRLGLRYEICAPDIDERPLGGETPGSLVRRLSEQKARKVAENFANALVIAGDQTATMDGEYIHKPGTKEKAVRQLQMLQGREVTFVSGLCVLDSATNKTELEAVECDVKFRPLSRPQIERYVSIDQPIHCAGSFKCESLGIALFDYLRADDPSAITGMPLISLVNLLGRHGFEVL